MVAELEPHPAEIPLDLETVATALEPLTLAEKQAAWFETMGYDPAETGSILRMAPATVEKIRVRAEELIRGNVDAWRRGLLADNGGTLGKAAAAAANKDCVSPKTFLDVLDGTEWREREEMARHVTGCWHCIDHFCRLAEVVGLLRGLQPLTPAEAEPFRKLLAIPEAKRPAWKRLLGAS